MGFFMSKRAFPLMSCWALKKMKFLHKAGPAYIHNRIGASPPVRAFLAEKKKNRLRNPCQNRNNPQERRKISQFILRLTASQKDDRQACKNRITAIRSLSRPGPPARAPNTQGKRHVRYTEKS
jgi:hypothetical protein